MRVDKMPPKAPGAGAGGAGGGGGAGATSTTTACATADLCFFTGAPLDRNAQRPLIRLALVYSTPKFLVCSTPGGARSVHAAFFTRSEPRLRQTHLTANLRTRILNFRGLDSSLILILRCGILMSIGNFPESSSRQILAGIILVGRLGVELSSNDGASPPRSPRRGHPSS